MHIGVVNKATKLSDGDAQTITAAVNGQVNDQFAPACFVLPAFFDPGC